MRTGRQSAEPGRGRTGRVQDLDEEHEQEPERRERDKRAAGGLPPGRRARYRGLVVQVVGHGS